ncbi:MAG: M14 family metallocarboxypeptidase [Clostridia bacterium]|nr:M14 family metallocarboxypeptidase [Clostridia bacterium]
MDFNNLDYEKMTKILSNLVKKYAFAGVFSCGKSVLGRDILCVRLGKGKRKIFLNGAHHSLEWITSSLLLNYACDYAAALRDETDFCGENILKIYNSATFYIVPMVNPDGVDFVINGIKKANPAYELVKGALGGKNIKKYWQANANGVDLNHNYDAYFDEGKKMEQKLGITGANYTRYSGKKPFSEPETQAVKSLFEKEKFDISIAFHSQGEEIYYDFAKKSKYKYIADALAAKSGYTVAETDGIASVTGFKDWVIDKFGLPSFTVEVGNGQNPLPFSQFEKIRKENYALITECVFLRL